MPIYIEFPFDWQWLTHCHGFMLIDADWCWITADYSWVTQIGAYPRPFFATWDPQLIHLKAISRQWSERWKQSKQTNNVVFFQSLSKSNCPFTFIQRFQLPTRPGIIYLGGQRHFSIYLAGKKLSSILRGLSNFLMQNQNFIGFPMVSAHCPPSPHLEIPSHPSIQSVHL